MSILYLYKSCFITIIFIVFSYKSYLRLKLTVQWIIFSLHTSHIEASSWVNFKIINKIFCYALCLYHCTVISLILHSQEVLKFLMITENLLAHLNESLSSVFQVFFEWFIAVLWVSIMHMFIHFDKDVVYVHSCSAFLTHITYLTSTSL